MKHPIRRTLTTLTTTAATAALILTGAAAASAHVSVAPESTAADGYSRLTFNVPNESPTAKTEKVEVALPTDKPFTYVAVKPTPGWTAQLNETDLPEPVDVEGATLTKAVTSVTWTADPEHKIGQQQYQSFNLSVGKLPAEGETVNLPATQTYDDGTVVEWDETATDGEAEPEHPAPAFETTAVADGHGGHGAHGGSDDGDAADGDGTAAAPAGAQDSAGVNTSATTSPMGVWGVVLGSLGLVLGGAALVVALRGRAGTSTGSAGTGAGNGGSKA